MICPNCGKDFEGNLCPSCGAQAPEPDAAASSRLEDGLDKKYQAGEKADSPAAPRPSRWMRNSLILVAVLALLSAGAAVAAQQYGWEWGWSLPEAGSSSGPNGAETAYETSLPSGHYVVGVDIPAGLYTITAEKGEGRLFTSLGVVDAELVADGGPETICGFEGVLLEVGDTLTANGMTIRVEGTANGSTSTRSNTASKTITLAVLSGAENGTTTDTGSAGTTTDPSGSAGSSTTSTAESTAPESGTGETGTTATGTTGTGTTGTTAEASPAPEPAPSATFTAGVDFPAGVYTVKVLRGTGRVSSGTVENGGIEAAMSLEEKDGAVKEFRNVNLSDGAELTVTGLDIQLVPSV